MSTRLFLLFVTCEAGKSSKRKARTPPPAKLHGQSPAVPTSTGQHRALQGNRDPGFPPLNTKHPAAPPKKVVPTRAHRRSRATRPPSLIRSHPAPGGRRRGAGGWRHSTAPPLRSRHRSGLQHPEQLRPARPRRGGGARGLRTGPRPAASAPAGGRGSRGRGATHEWVH